jgi:hypothetical protein
MRAAKFYIRRKFSAFLKRNKSKNMRESKKKKVYLKSDVGSRILTQLLFVVFLSGDNTMTRLTWLFH